MEEKKFTIVLDKDDNEIARFDEFVEVSPREFDGKLPVTYIYIRQEVIQKIKVER